MNQSSVTSLRRRLRFRPLFPAVIFSLLLSLCHAQTAGTGAISGTITDPSGAVVTNATIKAIDQTTGETRTAASSGGGAFQVPLLRPSTYRVEVSKGGFKQWVSEGVPVQITETVTLAVHLELGAPLETVEVSAASNLLTTEDSTLGNVVNERAVNSLPLVTRNYQQILGLSSGVAAEVFNAGEIGRGGVDSNVVTGGGVASDNNFQMNGVEINDLQGSGHFSGGVAAPNPDSIQEFKVQTSQYDASFGRNAGANVNVLTKSGSNRWHGSAWEYFRNEALNANDYFRKQTNEPRAILRQNQFGFALGGPVINSKLLFFTSYQGTRQQNGIDQNCSASDILPVLTDDRSPAALAAAVGPDTAFLGLDPLGRPVDATNVSPQAVALFSLKLANGNFLIPNPQQIITDPATGLPEGFSTFSSPCRYYEDQFVTNFDFLHTTKSTLQGRFFFSNSEANFTLPSARVAGSGSLPGSPSRNPQNFRNFSLTHTYLFNGNLVNQAEIGFHRTLAGTDQKFPFSYSGIGSSVPAFDDARPVIIVAGGFSVGGDGQTVVLAQNSYVFQDTLSWIHGRHSLRFGGGITRAQDNMSQFQFAGYSIFINYPGLMLGQAPFNPFVTQDLAGITQRHWRVWDGNLYAQDDIKVTRSLTLNLGFRYERLGDFGEINGRNASMDPSLIDRNPPDAGTLAGVVVSDNFPGTAPPGVTKSGNNLGIKGVGQNTMNPRVGFAWVLPGTNRLVMRGGYGVYHQRATGQPYLQQISNQPFGQIRLVQPAFNGSFANPLPPDPGPFPQFFPYSPTSELLSPQIIDPKVRPPIFQRYSLNLQSQLARDLVLQVGYTGMRGTHLLTWHTINQADLATPDHPIRGETTTTLTNLQLRVPYQGFSAGSMFDVQSNGIAWYNALEASLSKRLSHGLQFLASYTFSRDLANVFESTIGPNGGQVYGDNNDPRSNYGPDAFVRPHRFVFSGVYDLPGPRNSHSLAGQILGNWKLAGVLTAQSGHLLPVLTSTGTNAFGIPTDFAQLIPGCKLSTSGSVQNRLNNWINQDCVDPAGPAYVGDPDPPGTCADPNPQGVCARAFGNSRMGILRGPGQFNTDLSISKLFRLTERANLEFRTEFFNAFNNAVFADPDNTVTDVGSFGHITSTVSNPRVMQFAFKLSF